MAEADDKKDKDKKDKKPSSFNVGAVLGLVAKGLGIFVITLGAVVAGGYVNNVLHPPQRFEIGPDGKLVPQKAPATPLAKKKEEPPKPALYFAFDPPLIVNFDDQDAVRFLQLQIEVLSRDQKFVDAVKLHSPAIRNNFLMMMNGRDYRVLMTRDGKEALRKDLLAEVQRLIKRETGEPGVEDLFFTSFVVQ